MPLNDYSTTASANTSIGGVNVDEGMAPSDVNNAIRELMSHLADVIKGSTALTSWKVNDGATGFQIISATTASLLADFDVSGLTAQRTYTFPDADGTFAINGTDTISGDAIDGGTISNFASTGIDDNAAATALTIDSSGNLGIGETIPAVPLHITNVVPNIRFEDTTDNSYSDIQYNAGALEFRVDQGNTAASSIITFDVDASEAMRINDSGNVGIGETNPLGNLHVKTADSGGTVNASADELVLENSANAGMTILSGTTGLGYILFGDSGSNTIGQLNYNHSTNALGLVANGVERVSISGTAIDCNANPVIDSPTTAKCWAYITVSAGTPSLADDYNVASIADVSAGKYTINIGTDMGSVNYAPTCNPMSDDGNLGNHTGAFCAYIINAGSYRIICAGNDGIDGDPEEVCTMAFCNTSA